MTNPVAPNSVNFFYTTINLDTDAKKKLFLNATKDLSENQTNSGETKNILSFIQGVESKGQEYGFSTVTENIPQYSNYITFFKNPSKLNQPASKHTVMVSGETI